MIGYFSLGEFGKNWMKVAVNFQGKQTLSLGSFERGIVFIINGELLILMRKYEGDVINQKVCFALGN